MIISPLSTSYTSTSPENRKPEVDVFRECRSGTLVENVLISPNRRGGKEGGIEMEH